MVLVTLVYAKFFSTLTRPLLLSLLALMKVTWFSLTGLKLKLLDLARLLMNIKLRTNLSADTSILSVIIDPVWLLSALPSTMICYSLSMTSISAFGKLLLKTRKSLSSALNTLNLPITPVVLSLPLVLVLSSLQSKMVSTFGISLISLISLLKLLTSLLLSHISNSSSLWKVTRELSWCLMVMKWVNSTWEKSLWLWESAKKMKRSPSLLSGIEKSKSVNLSKREE